jgi:hypothetical protein
MPNSRCAVAVLCALAAGFAEAEPVPIVAVQAEEAPTDAAAAAEAGIDAAPEPDLDALLWVARPLVVFADTANDPRYVQQMTALVGGMAELEDRRVVVLTDTDPAANGPLRRALRPRGFGIVLIDTDGSVVQRRPSVTTVRELAGTIDRLPSRRQEIGSRRQ